MNEIHDRSSEFPAAASGVDVLSAVLGSLRLTGSMLFLVDAARPWATWAPPAEEFRPLVLPSSQHLISYHIITRGQCWAGLRGEPLELFETGDVLVIPHGDAYTLADPIDAKDSYGIEEAVEFFRRMAANELPTVISDGGDGAEKAQFICGFLGCNLRPFNPVLASLPHMLHLRSTTQVDDRMHHLIDFALCELRQQSSGGQDVLLRLAELMFIEVVRRHLETTGDTRSGWLAGLRDPLVARTLGLLHAAPARRWTLGLLAEQGCASRSVLADRFKQFVGEPPMHYLARWRMQMAARMLDESSAKIAAIANAVGYQSEAAFSRAFKKYVGIAPASWRAQRGRPSPTPANGTQQL